MHNDADTIETTETTDRGMSRRSLVRTGANLAWAVPAVSIATAAPALAVSPAPEPAKLSITGFAANYVGGRSGLHTVLTPVKNKGGSDAGRLTAVITLPEKQRGPFSSAPSLSGSTGPWSFAGRSGNGPWSFTFVSKDGHLKPGEKTGTLNASFDLTGPRKKHPEATISVAVVGNNSADSDSDTV